jgi:cell division protein FtsB
MQAPLRKGKKEETLGRAKGVKRTGQSLLFGLLLVSLVAASSISYTWERLVVESMLEENFCLEKELEVIDRRSEKLASLVAKLESPRRIRRVAQRELGMVPLDWENLAMIEQARGRGW